ncbi:hypothetical protein PGT21_011586 [Puccinia graminis f. sp. tritici]|uniref:Uncharacterized protein n=2 Tax=Puccinia graminis f. sp. tritici TaxID=56615 RepID=E3JYN0_PUCGT|nr:uncharacterized protein PGTG_03111 [Puccinia graminis f. sp. tritici CRL 75-36-700-3]EFP77155.1 hypothetical protein PGTG_03111 [Puccinia graminis f. sp. tritici CRL 75-36-700-3]KAA1114504.1 hypothetical protein PGT21_011586 [Puccinia graminis f. sp. tritici]
MPSDFATQIGVTRLPNLTGDGRDGFPSRAQHDWCVAQYLGEMCEKKRGKALIDKNLYDRILAVCFDDSNKKTETAQFRWWVRRTFKLYSEPHGHYLMHENRPIAVKEQIYDILVYAHAECGHGGRDKTSAAVRRYFSWIPKDVVSRFVSVCPGCHARTQKDDEYFSNKGVDGYYPVHDKVRQMSIDSRRSSVDDYKHTSPYQPLLAAGMVKILKAIEGARAFLPLSDQNPQMVHAPSASTTNVIQSNYLPIPGTHLLNFTSGSNCPSPLSLPQTPHRSIPSPANYSGPDGSASGVYRESFPGPVEMNPYFGSSYLNVPQSLGVPNYQARSLSLPAVGMKGRSSLEQEFIGIPTSSNPEIFTGRIVNARSKSQCSPFPHIAKPPRPSVGRKLSSKSKEYKKMVLPETYVPSADIYCPTSYYGSQSSAQSLSNSEDDGNSKSTFSSPPTYQTMLQYQGNFQDYSLSQSSNQELENLQPLDLHQQVGPFGEYASEHSVPDFSALSNLPISHLSYMDPYNADAFLSGVQVPESWNIGTDGICDYMLPDLLNSQLFDNSPTDYCTLVNLQTPGAPTDALGNDAQLESSTFPALDSWSSGSGSQELYNMPDPCYQTLYLPINQANADLFQLGPQTIPSDIDTHHQGLTFPNNDCFKNLSTMEPSSSYPPNSLGINFPDEFQFGPNPIY